jgi:hypothetical protein
MPIYIDSSGTLHHDQAHNFALTCPHCEVLAHITPVSVPSYAALVAMKPSHVGIVYRCDACNAPLFLKFPVRMYAGTRVELAGTYQELERPREKFDVTHLPDEIDALCREALACFSAGCWNAFGSMCRRIAQSTFQDLGEHGKLKMFDQLNDSREMAELDQETFNLLRRVLFATDSNGGRNTMPPLDANSAGILLEVLKDLLYQCYVRRGRLQQAMMMRRRFTTDDSAAKVTLLGAKP